ncbi:MAG: rhodanese-like domain-containing protein [Caldilineales bacterium]|nr:rhodanese-like domain-containing protein [Caldilineales bacterium]MDW8317257.1 rhodanese-like domain-containing protein [Anaerolineae bacterium]
MGLFDRLKRDKTAAQPTPAPAPAPAAERRADPAPAPQRQARPQEIAVPEVSARDLIPRLNAENPPLLLDCREPFEWHQIRIPGSLHIPMNQIPGRLHELDREREWVVVCAHGNRSYAVAGFLIMNGFKASSLAGGVTDWWMHKGPTESDYR